MRGDDQVPSLVCNTAIVEPGLIITVFRIGNFGIVINICKKCFCFCVDISYSNRSSLT